MAQTLEMLDESVYYAVVKIDGLAIVYIGDSDWAAAKALAPGTAHGSGNTPDAALWNARAAVGRIIEGRKAVA